MSQLRFFDDEPAALGIPKDLLDYQPGVFTPEEGLCYLKTFTREVPWIQRMAWLYGKEVITPRLTAFYGDGRFSLDPLPWTPELLAIRNRIEPLAGCTFNSVLLNYYRDGNDSVSWHSDNDGIPGRNRIVASVSFGQVRRFDVRSIAPPSQQLSILLENGSYLLMHGDFQDHWQHRVAKSTKPLGPRVNLTFRNL
jgi:alkylated DNA repair dioxygenase AlkB